MQLKSLLLIPPEGRNQAVKADDLHQSRLKENDFITQIKLQNQSLEKYQEDIKNKVYTQEINDSEGSSSSSSSQTISKSETESKNLLTEKNFIPLNEKSSPQNRQTDLQKSSDTTAA